MYVYIYMYIRRRRGGQRRRRARRPPLSRWSSSCSRKRLRRSACAQASVEAPVWGPWAQDRACRQVACGAAPMHSVSARCHTHTHTHTHTHYVCSYSYTCFTERDMLPALTLQRRVSYTSS